MAIKKRKRKPRKETGPKVSTIAAKILNEIENHESFGGPISIWYTVKRSDLKKICASVLSQDETKGQWTKKS